VLWLGLHLPCLPLEIFTRAGEARAPLAVVEGEGRGQQVVLASESARRLGIVPGLGTSAALALAHELLVQPRDTVAERAALERTAAWALQFTPAVHLADSQSLALEVEGSGRLFGGHEALLARVRAGIAALGYAAHLALAPTALAALWLARCAREELVTDPAALPARLAPLPLAVLGLSAAQQALFAGLGVSTLGACQRLPRDGLARRAGAEFVEMLDRACGRRPDPRAYYTAPPRYRGELALPAPVAESEALLFALNRLLQELAGFLAARHAAVSELALTLAHARHPPTRVALRLVQPARDAAHLHLLFRERLARTALPEAVETVVLEGRELCEHDERSQDLFPSSRASPGAQAALIERLTARLGRAAVVSVEPVAEHRPERAWRYVDPVEAKRAGEAPAEPEDPPRRPLWLLPQPLALTEREGLPWLTGPLALESEAERIESGWWDGQDVTRDYFIARHAAGALLWIYRELTGDRRWFLHGVFG
jgi:protein ImuB